MTSDQQCEGIDRAGNSLGRIATVIVTSSMLALLVLQALADQGAIQERNSQGDQRVPALVLSLVRSV